MLFEIVLKILENYLADILAIQTVNTVQLVALRFHLAGLKILKTSDSSDLDN